MGTLKSAVDRNKKRYGITTEDIAEALDTTPSNTNKIIRDESISLVRFRHLAKVVKFSFKQIKELMT